MRLPGLIFQQGMRLVFGVLISGAISGSALGAPADELRGTLPEDYLPQLRPILESALRQAPSVLLREIEYARQQAGMYLANAPRFPEIAGDLRFASSRTAVSSRTDSESRDQGLFYSIGVNQALFHWGALQNASALGRIRLALAASNHVEACRSLAVELRRQYLALIARRAGLVQARFQLGVSEAELKLAKERLAVGDAPSSEVGSRELAYEEELLRVERLQAEFDAELRQFIRLTGARNLKEDDIPTVIPLPTFPATASAALLGSFLRDGGKSVFEVKMAELQIEEADLNYRIARVRLLPKFDAAAGYRLQNVTSATADQTAIAEQFVEVKARWTFFDGFATRGAKLQALQDKRQWAQRRAMAEEGALDLAQRLGRAVGFDARALRFSEVRRTTALGNLDQARRELQLGQGSQRAVDSALNEVRLAEYNSALTHASFLSSWSAFISLTAEDPLLKTISFRHGR